MMSQHPSTSRVDPFALDDLGDFTPTTIAKPKPEVAAIREASEAQNFPSRAPVAKGRGPAQPEPRIQRRHRTGRNVQFNIKTTAQTVERFIKLADANGWVLGETLDRALDALEATAAKAIR